MFKKQTKEAPLVTPFQKKATQNILFTQRLELWTTGYATPQFGETCFFSYIK